MAVLALGVVGALLMIAAELTPLFEVEVAVASCEDLAQPELADLCLTRGGEQHAYGLVLLALVVVTAVVASVVLASGGGVGEDTGCALPPGLYT